MPNSDVTTEARGKSNGETKLVKGPLIGFGHGIHRDKSDAVNEKHPLKCHNDSNSVNACFVNVLNWHLLSSEQRQQAPMPTALHSSCSVVNTSFAMIAHVL